MFVGKLRSLCTSPPGLYGSRGLSILKPVGSVTVADVGTSPIRFMSSSLFVGLYANAASPGDSDNVLLQPGMSGSYDAVSYPVPWLLNLKIEK